MTHLYVLTDLAGRAISELPRAYGKNLAIPYRAAASLALTVPGVGRDADALLSGDALVRVYSPTGPEPADRTLIAHLRLVSAEEVGDPAGVSVAATFSDPWWILGKRDIGRGPGGYSAGTSTAMVDRGVIASGIVDLVNAEAPTGLVSMGPGAASGPAYVGPWYDRSAADAIAEVCGTLDGPDWRITPTEYAGGTIGRIEFGPAIGVYRPNAVFEFGDGKLNVRSYRRGITNEGLANRITSRPPGYPDPAFGSTQEVRSEASIAARGLFDGQATADVASDALRLDLARTHLAARATARQTITLEPTSSLGGRVPMFRRDFDVGDVLPFRATVLDRDTGAKVKRVNVNVRVYGYGSQVTNDGVETTTITVTAT